MPSIDQLSPYCLASMQSGYHKRFEEVAAILEDFTALRFEDESISYHDLNRRANQLAHAIQATTDAPFIITWVADDITAIILMLAVAKLARTWVPLTYRTPPASLLEYADKFDDALFLTDRPLPDELQQLRHPILILDNLTLPENPTQISLDYAPDDIVNILSTSGSTGVPKGLPIVQENVAMGLAQLPTDFPFDVMDGVMFIGDPTFTGNIASVRAALCVGASLNIINLRQAGVDGFHEQLKQHRIVYLACVPSAFRVLFAHAKPDDFPDLRTIRMGGEACLSSDIALFKKNFGAHTTLFNSLGATEIGAIAHFPIDRTVSYSDDLLPVGRPRPYLDVYIHNEAGESVINEAGEMVIRAKKLLPYWRNPEASAGKFIVDAENPDWVIFRTGDLALIREDGLLIHLGRVDDQVKVRGQRVEIAAVENRLYQHPSVEQAAVNAYTSQNETRLAAYLVLKKDVDGPNDSMWRAYLAQNLPEYMIPTRFIVMDELPSLPTGKLNRNALPDPERDGIERDTAIIKPTTSTQQHLLAIWQDILGFKGEISIEDSFFDLGGSSLQATALISDVNEIFNVLLTPALLYQKPSILELASLIDDGTMSVSLHPSLVPLRPFGKNYPIFCLTGSVGNPLAFKLLAQRLGRDYPIYALQIQGTDGLTPLPANLDELLDYYQAAIESLQLRIPIYLMGLSLGGVHAIELARRLKERNYTVENVIMLDTYFPNGEIPSDFVGDEEDYERLQETQRSRLEKQRRLRRKREVILRRMRTNSLNWLKRAIWIIDMARLSPKKRQQKWQARQQRMHEDQQLERRIQKTVRRPHVDSQHLTRNIRAAMRNSMQGYYAQPYDGHVVYLKAKRIYHGDALLPDRDRQWARMVTGKFQVLELNTSHDMLSFAYVDKTIQALRDNIL